MKGREQELPPFWVKILLLFFLVFLAQPPKRKYLEDWVKARFENTSKQRELAKTTKPLFLVRTQPTKTVRNLSD